LTIGKGKSSQKIWATSVIFEKLSKVSNHPLGEKSLNLVTLMATDGRGKTQTA
jgi:hypothetical protein